MGRKRNFVIAIGLLALLPVAASRARATSSPVVTAKAAILIDNRTGEVLWQRNPDLPLPPASTTKIVTAMLALQSGRLDDSFSVTSEAAQAPPSKIRLRPGWRMRLRDLVYAVLLNSANDASVVIAEGLAGSVHDFAANMNAYARKLGATNTHFVNPNGLPADNHYTTARDLATMFSHALQNPLFETIVSTKSTVVSPTSGSARPIALHSHNRLLGNYRVRVVGKTGWTLAAKKCFVGAAQTEQRELVVAVHGSRDLWGDLKRLLEFGLSGTNPPAAEAAETDSTLTNAPPVASGDDDDDVKSARPAQYSVQLATFRNLDNAKRFKQSIARNGYRARVDRISHGRTVLYRVSIDGYRSQREAERAAANLKKAHRQIAPVVVASN